MFRGSREKVVKNAEKYVSRGKIEAGIKEYRKLLDENPNDISTLNRVGDLYARIDRNNQAIELFEQIAEQYADDGFLVKAIAIYKKIIKLDPTRLEIYEKLADLYHRQGLVNEARTQYQVLADYYVKHDQPASLASVYERMVELEPEDPSHRVKLADLCQEIDRVDDAMEQYRAIAELMLEHGRPDEAAQVYRQALTVSAKDLEFIADGVLRLKEAGHVGRAARLLVYATERNPEARRVARLAGLDGGADEAREEAPASEGVPAPGEAAEAEEAPAQVEPAATEETEEPAAPPEPAFEDEELAVFELDLDDDDSLSQVEPPADMLEDRERPGFAWSDDAGEPAAQEPDVAAGRPAGRGAGGSGTFEFELDLEADGDGLLEDDAADEKLDHDLLERTASEVEPAPEDERAAASDDLFTEAEVLFKYGIVEKALERLAELLDRDPRHLEGYGLMMTIHLEAERHDRAAEVAGRLAEVAEEVGDEEVWPAARDRLEAAGHRVEGRRVEPPPGFEAPQDVDDEVGPDEPVTAVSEPPAIEPIPVEEEAGPAEGGERRDAPGRPEMIEVAFDEELFDLPEIPAPESEAAPAEEAETEPEEVEPEAPPRPRRKVDDVEAALAELAADFLGPRSKIPAPEAPAVDDARPAEEPPPTDAGPPAEEEALRAEAAEAPPAPEAPATPPPESVPPPGETPRVDPLRALGDSLREEIGQPLEGAAAAQHTTPGAGEQAAGPARPEADRLDDSGVSWLDEVSAEGGGAELFEGEDGFFDLGAELEQELEAEESIGEGEELLLSGEGPSLEDIVEGFKRGVAENLSTEDFDTHFNLGIAYREMGLLDEAIGEFQLASKGAGYMVPCASMLGLCFLEKGLPELAVKWYRRGLGAEGISEEDQLGLLYDLGNAQAAAGDPDAAYETFVELYGVNTNYRDVVARLAELEPHRGGS